MHFRASVVPETADGRGVFQFRRHSDGITFCFTLEERKHLQTLLSASMAEPGIQVILQELSFAYGEL
jgi:hypothetical protein